MRKIKDFCKEKSDVIVGTILILSVFYLVFSLGSLDVSYFRVGAGITGFLLLSYLFFSFPFYKKEEEIRKSNERLTEENEGLRILQISTKRELMDYFVLWVHQIKTPITASGLILEEEESEDREKRLKTQLFFIEQYTDMAMNFLKVLNNDTDMDIADVDLDRVLRLLIKKYSVLFIAKHLRVEYERIGETVISDTKLLTVLIEQFLSNALKYTESGFIGFSFDKETRTLKIEDSGMGIRSEDLPKIFDRGYSGFNGRLDQKASGLGLFLAKKIADKLEIRISVKSEVGKGSTFFLHFEDNLSKM